MTSSKLSENPSHQLADPSAGHDACQKCGGPTRLRNARPFPVLLQVAFGISFVLFLWAQSALKVAPLIFWIWSGVQVVLGILLVRARYASAKKVFICLRCGAPLG